VAVRRAHHRDLDALVAQPGDAACPLSFHRPPPFELEAELAEELDRGREVFDDDSHVVHPFDGHVTYRLATKTYSRLSSSSDSPANPP
jgi:hypothetical protein